MSPRTGVRSDRQLEFPQTVQPRRNRDAEEQEQELGPDGRPLPPRFKGGDTVLLTLEIRQFKRKAPEIEERERREQQQAMQPSIPGRQLQLPQQRAGNDVVAAVVASAGRDGKGHNQGQVRHHGGEIVNSRLARASPGP